MVLYSFVVKSSILRKVPKLNVALLRAFTHQVDSKKFIALNNNSVTPSISNYQPFVTTCRASKTFSPLYHQQTSYKSLHSSSNNAASANGNIAPKRRRRRGNLPTVDESTSNDDRDDNNKNIGMPSKSPVKDRKKFVSTADAFLDELEKALKPMTFCNDIFEIVRMRNESGKSLSIGLKPGHGTYIMQIDETLMTLTLSSPKSGVYTYTLRGNGDWAGMDDGHLMKGLLTRDLIQQCNGLPDF